MPSSISRPILRIYQFYQKTHSIIRGCGIVFVSGNRLILVVLLCILLVLVNN